MQDKQAGDDMSEFANAMEVFKLLDKSNCRKCNEQTCLAFASKVFLGERHLNEYPALSHEILDQYRDRQKKNRPVENTGIPFWSKKRKR